MSGHHEVWVRFAIAALSARDYDITSSDQTWVWAAKVADALTAEYLHRFREALGRPAVDRDIGGGTLGPHKNKFWVFTDGDLLARLEEEQGRRGLSSFPEVIRALLEEGLKP